MKCSVVNKYKSEYDVYIGRGSLFGNPYVIGKDGTREEVITKFTSYFKTSMLNGAITKKDLVSLKGKRLGCFCYPQACHGDVIAEVVNKL